MALTQTQVSKLYVTVIGRASEGAGNAYWQSATSMENAADEMLGTQAVKDYFGASLDDDQAFIEHIYLNTLGKTYAQDQDGIDFWVGQLAEKSRGEVVVDLINAVESYADSTDPVTKAAYDRFNNRVEVSDYVAEEIETADLDDLDTFEDYINDVTDDSATVVAAKFDVDVDAAKPVEPGEPGDPDVPSTPGETFILSEGRDNVVGTANDDSFYGDVGQNSLGAVSNAFASGDVIDGGAGYDTLSATMIQDNEVDDQDEQAPMPRVNNVEEFRLNAMEEVVLDADLISGEQHYASENSRDDLTITNVGISASQITQDIVLEMKNTQQNSDLEVYFNEMDLKAAPDVTTQNAEFFIQVADGNAQDSDAPIANIEFDLSFTQDGTTEFFENLTSTDGTYAGLVTAVKVAFSERGLTGYSVSLGDAFTNFTTTSGQTFNLDYTGYYVNIVDDGGEPFDNIEFTPTQKTGTELAIILAQSDIRSEISTLTNRVEASVIFDGVGRGSDGGEVIVGSTSDSGTSTGIEVFNVEVRNTSVVHDISTTNESNTSWAGFQELNLTNGDGFAGDFVLTNQVYTGLDTGYYDNVGHTIGSPGFNEGLAAINATDFDGDIVLGRDNDIVNLGALNAAVAGDVTYNATIDTGVEHTAVTGSGDDQFNITLDNDSDIVISAGNGANIVNVAEAVGSDSAADITTGSGSDLINGNAVSVTVDAGAGNDVIYAENTGAKSVDTFTNDATAFTVATPATDTVSKTDGTVHFLAGKQVQVTVAVGAAAAAHTTGYESKLITIAPSNGALTTRADLNNAILEAVNEDQVLNKIVTAEIDGDDVVFTYLVDGVQDANALDIDIVVPSNISATPSAAMVTEYRDLVNDSSTDVAALWTASNAPQTIATTNVSVGTDSVDADNNNVVNGGAGDDVIVLSSEGTVGDTVVYTGYSQGNDTIVHFETTVDELDFTSYLTGTVPGNTSTSTSPESEVALTNTAAANETFTANSINLIDFNALDNMATGATFENATVAQITAALNTDGDNVISATADLYQTNATSVLVVHDGANGNAAVTGDIQNDGTYKAYEVSYANTDVAAATDKNFTVKLIGAFDLGDDVLVAGDFAV